MRARTHARTKHLLSLAIKSSHVLDLQNNTVCSTTPCSMQGWLESQSGALGAVSLGMETPQHLWATSANVWLSSLWKLFSLACGWNSPWCNLWSFYSQCAPLTKGWLHLFYKLWLGRCSHQEDPSQHSPLQAEQVQPSPPGVLQPMTILVALYSLSKPFLYRRASNRTQCSSCGLTTETNFKDMFPSYTEGQV